MSIDKFFARNNRAALNQVRNRRVVLAVHDLGTCRWTTVDGVLNGVALVNHLECQLGGLAEDVFKPFRVFKTGDLNQDAVVALAVTAIGDAPGVGSRLQARA